MSPDLAARITLEEGAPLLQAVVHHEAEANQLRVLAIKGPSLAVLGLRDPRPHADIDVLAAPSDLDAVVAMMEEIGWRRALESTAPTLLPAHSVNLLNDWWPLSIDAHHYFPGFLAPPDAVFEALWCRRTTVELAGAPVLTPDRVAHAAIAALHLLREKRPETDDLELELLVQRASRTLSVHDLDELVDFAEVTGAAVTLGPFLEALGRPSGTVTGPGHHAQLASWNKRVSSPRSSTWIYQLGSSPLRRWPQLIWRAVLLSDDEIRTFHGGDGESLLRARVRRLRRGFRSVPRAAFDLWRQKAREWVLRVWRPT